MTRRHNGIPGAIRTREGVHHERRPVRYGLETRDAPARPKLSDKEHHARKVRCSTCCWKGTLGRVADRGGRCPSCGGDRWLA